jgi:hypothetical protein
MRRSLLIGAAVFLVAGCVDDSSRVLDSNRALGPVTPIELTRITPNASSIIYYSGLVNPVRMVMGDPATLASVWARDFVGESEPPSLPSVDFRRERVIVAALGEKPSGRYGIEFASADVEGREIVVELVSTAVGENCMVAQSLTQPVDVAKIPLRQMAIRFVEHAAVRDCSRP